MNVPNGRKPLLWLLSCLLTHCTGDADSTESPETSSTEPVDTTGDTTTPTTGAVPPDGTEAGHDTSSGTGDEPPASTGNDSSTTLDENDESGSSSSTGVPSPVCGDGILDEGEECDDGFVANTLNGACLPDCVKARCGDGFVHAGGEECDLGEAGNSFDYGGCNKLTCKWGPHCGDGQVDPPNEVCDPGDPDGQGDGVAACDNDCRFQGRLVFLSSVKFDGNLGGLAGADKLCRDLAATFDENHADTYRAWLSDNVESPQSRFAHGPEFDGVPYVLRSGVQIAANFTDLTVNGPSLGIDMTDAGEVVTFEHVWTNTGVDGAPLTEDGHCNEWTTNMNQVGRKGINSLPADSPDLDAWYVFGQWTNGGGAPCSLKLRLYCFEN